jgi:hypothetical protein
MAAKKAEKSAAGDEPESAERADILGDDEDADVIF